MSRVVKIGVAVCVLLAGAPAYGQQPAPKEAPEVQQQLLSEVRQLRAVLERAASESAALQVVAVRAAMQEERLWRISREVDTLRTSLFVASRDAQEVGAALKQFERQIADETDSGRRQSLEAELPAMRTRLRIAREKEQQLQQQEAAMAGSLSTEEDRWQAINARLDEIERRLLARAP
jgi:chromosome segregation ATPase